MTIFQKKLKIYKAVKGTFCVFLTQSWRKIARSAQKLAFPLQYLHKKLFSQETQAIWKKISNNF